MDVINGNYFLAKNSHNFITLPFIKLLTLIIDNFQYLIKNFKPEV